MNKRHCLGIDIGGTSTKFSVVSEVGEISEMESFQTGSDISSEMFLNNIYRIVNDAVSNGIYKVGIGTVGVVDENSCEILSGVDNLPMLKGLNLKKLLQNRHNNIDVYVCNDVEAAARGELWMGSAKKAESLFYITLGTGLGGAYFLNGKPVRGAHFRAGEIAYLDYVTEGNYLETELSTYYVMQEAADLLGRESIDGFEFFDLVRAKNKTSIKILESWVNRIAGLISNLIIILDPELIILGGGISNEREILLNRLRKRISERLPLEFRNESAAFDLATLGSKSGIIGAASQCFIT